MRKLFSALLFCIAFISHSYAQTATDTTWKRGGFVSVGVAQTGYSNWAPGGENSFTLNGLFNGFYNYRFEKTSWENSLNLAYGLIQTNGNSLRKSDDRIELSSKFGKLAKGKFFYSALLNFNTQFTPGYNYPNDSIIVSEFLAPAYLSLAVGMDYRPVDYFSVFISPATGRLIIVNNTTLADAGTYGNDAAIYDAVTGAMIAHGKKTRFEFGSSLSAKFQKDIFKNVNLFAKLNLFNNYTDRNASNRGNIDVNFEGLLSMKVNKFISATISTVVVYDDDVKVPLFKTVDGVKVPDGTGKRTQIKEVIGVGFAYKF